MPADTSNQEALRLLALETSGQAGSVAALVGDKLMAERPLDHRQRSAQSLAPAVRDLLDALAWRLADIRALAVTIGPGSFTGLRIGAASVKGILTANPGELVLIDSLEARYRSLPASEQQDGVTATRVLKSQHSEVTVLGLSVTGQGIRSKRC